MKRISLVTLFIGLLGITSCEQEADPIDFVNLDGIEDSLGLGEAEEEAIDPNIPSEENPILSGTANGVNFNVISAVLTQRTVNQEEVLTIVLVDAEENQITLTVSNPITRMYVINMPGTPSFDAEYVEALSGDGFVTMGSASSSGTLNLAYRSTGDNSAVISAEFNFIAFVEASGDSVPSRSVTFDQGNIFELPVIIN